ncbi:hypothetical protein DFH27DRAFT_236708 [Peziza echinospora]|nr:hypothetical protein DFH27DRAFT_236708 [Peziza echinospora]
MWMFVHFILFSFFSFLFFSFLSGAGLFLFRLRIGSYGDISLAFLFTSVYFSCSHTTSHQHLVVSYPLFFVIRLLPLDLFSFFSYV